MTLVWVATLPLFTTGHQPLEGQVFRHAPNSIEIRQGPGPACEIDIKTFLRPVALLRLLQSLRRYEPLLPIVVADDGDLSTSSDPDSLACRSWMAADGRCRLIQLPWNAGVSAGRNALFDACRAPYLLLLDDDFVFTSDTSVSKMQARLDYDPEVGLVAGVVIDAFDGNRWRRRSGGTLTVAGGVLHYQTEDCRHRPRGLRDFVPNFLLVRREVMDEIRWDGPLVARFIARNLPFVEHVGGNRRS